MFIDVYDQWCAHDDRCSEWLEQDEADLEMLNSSGDDSVVYEYRDGLIVEVFVVFDGAECAA